MSMLAEPRRKQKVINLRAKSNAWSNDSTKFGQRMLEKMGWSSGKGLGAKENGIVEHVVARYKNDEKGLGFEDRNDQWTKHEDDFNSLLANLSNAEGGTEKLHSGISLEKKSKKSKARIHYHKFTRGKDLSRYSEKDLANIFGKKSFKEPEATKNIKEDTLKPTEQVFTEKGNMDDYFKTKLDAIRSKRNTDTNSQDNQESDYTFQGFSNTTELESNQTGFGYQPFCFYSSLKEDVSQNIELTCPGDKPKSKKKNKSRKKEISKEEIIEGNNLLESNQEVTLEMMDVATKVKSKKKQHKECIEETQTSIFNIRENSSEYTHIQNKQSSKRSKKKKHQESDEEEIQLCEEASKVKKNKNKNHVENIQKHIITEDSVPKKKKKRKNKDL